MHSNFEDLKLGPKPAYGEVTPSQAQTVPQPYVEFVAIGGVTSDSVAIVENPVSRHCCIPADRGAFQDAESPPYE